MSNNPYESNIGIKNALKPRDTFASRLRNYQLMSEYATDEKNKEDKKKLPWWKQLLPDSTTPSALAKGFISIPKSLTADIPQSIGEAYLTDPYGFSTGDKDLKTDDPNHNEYIKALDLFENTIRPELSALGQYNKINVDQKLKDAGFVNSSLGPNGLYTSRSQNEQTRIIQESTFSEYTQNWSNWYKDKQDWYGDTSDIWINQLVETTPQFATQLLATIYGGPIGGMTYGGGLMFSDTYQTARPYVLKGDLDVNEAHRLATTVGLVSWATNYAPSMVYSSYIKQPKMFKDILFDKLYKKGLYKNLTIETFKGSFAEGIQESIDEFSSLTAEGTYRDISSDEWWDRIITSGTIGMTLGGGSSVSLAHINNKNVKKEVIPKIVEAENLLLPDIMTVDENGDFKVDVKEEDFSSTEDFENAKTLIENPEFKKKIDPFEIAEKNRKKELDGEPEVPLNMMIFNELNTENPNTDDVNIEFNSKAITTIMSDADLVNANYDPEDFTRAEIKEGEDAYEEGKRKFKVWTLGSNIYNSSGGNIVLTEGVNQDVFVEEVVETLFKKLSTTNPELKQKIDKWVMDMGDLLDNNKVGGVRGIELFSKWYTFNYLGYLNKETDLKDVVALPEDIVREFDKIMGEQKDGTNVAFLYKGGDPIVQDNIITEEDAKVDEPPTQENIITEEDTKVEEPPVQDNIITEDDAKVDEPPVQDNLLDEESFRLSPQKLSTINNFLMEVTKEGETARFWYEDSGQALLDIVDGDYDKARKLLAIISITSPQMDVKSNFGQMIKANYKYVQGKEPEAGRFPTAMAKRIKNVMEGKNFGGIKTNSFLDNLLVQLEQYERSPEDRPVTVDLWMMRAFGFDKDVPTDLEYKQIRTAVQKIADKLGWKPHQVQASIWTSIQARWNFIYNQEKAKAIKSGVLKKEGRKYVWRSKKSEQNFRKKLFKLLKTTSIEQKAIEDANFNYADAVNVFKGVISTETFPHPSTGVFEGFDLAFEQQLEYDYDIRQILVDKNGKDKIAKLIGLLEVGKFNAPGFYEGGISPSEQLEVLMSTTDVEINEETKTLLELYASIYGILTKQQAVGVTKVFQSKSDRQANVVMVDVKGSIPFEQIYSELLALGYNTGAIPQNYGFNIVRFGSFANEIKDVKNEIKANPKDATLKNKLKKLNKKQIEFLSGNKKFQNDVENIINKIYENSSETINFELGQSDGLYIDNNWEENPNGESYKQRISKSEQQDVIEQFINSTSDEISKVNETYKQKWSEESFRLTSKPSLHLDPPTVLQNIATTLQDQMLRLKVVQEKIGEIPEDQDAYMQSELFIGTATEKIDNFRTEVLEPLVKQLTDAGFTIDDLGDYLYAKHSGERNDLILERTYKLDDDNKLVEEGSGMSSDDITLDDGTVIEGSKTILNKFKDTNIDQFADQVYDILNQRLDLLYNNGMITKEDYDYFKGDKLFTNYVPLKGLPGDNTNPQIGKGFSILGKDIKKARGRGSRANNPFIQSIMDFEETIIRTEKNKVTEAFYNLVLANPSDIWSAKGVKHIPRFDKNGELQYLDPIDLKQNEIEVKIEGKRKIITINDPALLSSMQRVGTGKSISWLNTFNTYFRNINTIFNPEFIITNFTRDLQTGLFNLSADHKSLSKQVLKNIVKAQLGIRSNIKGKDSEWARLYQEYKDNGGKVGWFDQMTLEDKTKNLESLLKKYKSKSMVGNSLRVVQKAVMDWNEMVEMGVRVATYKVLIDNGVSPKKSAQYSKNLTVNFNKKGEAGAVLNSLYVFSNAGIQGPARLFQMSKTKRGKQIIAGLVASGFIQSFLNRLVDDEEWEQYSDYDKDNYWLFLMPNGKSMSVKLPYGYNVFKATGGLLEEMMFGDLSFPDAGKRFLNTLDNGFNPFGGGSLLQVATPTVGDPFVQIYQNKNFFGGPIMPEQPPYSPKTRDSKRYFQKTIRTPSKNVAEWLNDVTGGSEDVSGLIDVSPETLDHLYEAYSGGVGKFVANFIENGTTLAKDGKFPALNNIPIVRQFAKESSEWTSSKIVYEMINESERKRFSKEQRQKFSRHINYMKKGEFNRKRYSKSEWLEYLNKLKDEMSQNQSSLK
tara:strand:- start:7889 stop:14128 length:6240 start_codon:yes stop_codon:yes gene_type:complete